MEEVYEKLRKNVENLNKVENECSSIKLEIYQRESDEIKAIKKQDIEGYFNQQAKTLGQKMEKYQDKIEEIIHLYEEQINKVIEIYNALYIQVFRIMQNARNNQKIAIANIVTMEENKEVAIACAQKKINYSVIIDECKARIDWCIENMKNDINAIFMNELNQLIVPKNTIWNTIKNKISNAISGRKKFNIILEDYKTNKLMNIKNQVNSRTIDVTLTIAGVRKQMEIVKKQIDEQYNKSCEKIIVDKQ